MPITLSRLKPLTLILGSQYYPPCLGWGVGRSSIYFVKEPITPDFVENDQRDVNIEEVVRAYTFYYFLF